VLHLLRLQVIRSQHPHAANVQGRPRDEIDRPQDGTNHHHALLAIEEVGVVEQGPGFSTSVDSL
jgi:hypothetical protein